MTSLSMGCLSACELCTICCPCEGTIPLVSMRLADGVVARMRALKGAVPLACARKPYRVLPRDCAILSKYGFTTQLRLQKSCPCALAFMHHFPTTAGHKNQFNIALRLVQYDVDLPQQSNIRPCPEQGKTFNIQLNTKHKGPYWFLSTANNNYTNVCLTCSSFWVFCFRE